jgi:hypothetical protein
MILPRLRSLRIEGDQFVARGESRGACLLPHGDFRVSRSAFRAEVEAGNPAAGSFEPVGRPGGAVVVQRASLCQSHVRRGFVGRVFLRQICSAKGARQRFLCLHIVLVDVGVGGFLDEGLVTRLL